MFKLIIFFDRRVSCLGKVALRMLHSILLASCFSSASAQTKSSQKFYRFLLHFYLSSYLSITLQQCWMCAYRSKMCSWWCWCSGFWFNHVGKIHLFLRMGSVRLWLNEAHFMHHGLRWNSLGFLRCLLGLDKRENGFATRQFGDSPYQVAFAPLLVPLRCLKKAGGFRDANLQQQC